MDLLRYAYELRKPENFQLPNESLKELKIGEKELRLAAQLVEAMQERWDPDHYRDEYRDQVMALIERKVKSGKTAVIEEAPGRSWEDFLPAGVQAWSGRRDL